jgi:hypothetical protein
VTVVDYAIVRAHFGRGLGTPNVPIGPAALAEREPEGLFATAALVAQ